MAQNGQHRDNHHGRIKILDWARVIAGPMAAPTLDASSAVVVGVLDEPTCSGSTDPRSARCLRSCLVGQSIRNDRTW
jgi:hypothetical protein